MIPPGSVGRVVFGHDFASERGLTCGAHLALAGGLYKLAALHQLVQVRVPDVDDSVPPEFALLLGFLRLEGAQSEVIRAI